MKGGARSLEATAWVGHGTGRLFNRDGLSANHPESWPALWIKKYGDLDGFPTEKVSINGACKDGSVYYVCNHCKCVSVIGNEDVMYG